MPGRSHFHARTLRAIQAFSLYAHYSAGAPEASTAVPRLFQMGYTWIDLCYRAPTGRVLVDERAN
jgi:hypothetical protein